MMKKLMILFMFIGMMFLSGCDYDEKSLQALGDSEVPDEVTMDFELPRGVYGEIIYSSSNEEVLVFENVRFAKVTQQLEDCEIIITARVNRATKKFTINVLKIGSTPTSLEQARIAFDKLVLPEKIDDPYLLPQKIDNIDFRYEQYHPYRLDYDPYRIVSKTDGSVWLVPNLLIVASSGQLIIRAFQRIANKDVFILEQIVAIEFGAKVAVTDYDLIIDEVMIGTKLANRRFRVESKFNLPTSSLLFPQAIITWESKNQSIIQISQDKTTATLIAPFRGIHEVQLIAYITLDEITHPLMIWVEVSSN